VGTVGRGETWAALQERLGLFLARVMQQAEDYLVPVSRSADTEGKQLKCGASYVSGIAR